MIYSGVDVQHGEKYSELTVLGTLSTKVEVYNFTDNEIKKMCGAVYKLHHVLNSEAFKYYVLNHKYMKRVKTGWFKSKMVETEGFHFHRYSDYMTNQEVYATIMDGRETLQPTTSKVANIKIKLNKSNKRGVLGYTYPSSTFQWIYNWFFRSGTTGDVAGNTGHEWLHKLGFGHTRGFNSNRGYSVNYALGYFIRDMNI